MRVFLRDDEEDPYFGAEEPLLEEIPLPEDPSAAGPPPAATTTEGPSVSSSQQGVLARMVMNPHKAGLAKVDAAKVNQIVYQASKDSPFFQHQQVLQRKLSARIDAMLAQYKQCPSQPPAEVVTKVDRLVKQMEKHRKVGKTIVHVDMDMFYAAVEMRDDPSLKTKPMAVGSIGMLTTANYIARQYGVRAAMPGYIGKKLCPELVIVPNNHLKYIQVSKTVRTVFEKYDPKFVYLSFLADLIELLDLTGTHTGPCPWMRPIWTSRPICGDTLT